MAEGKSPEQTHGSPEPLVGFSTRRVRLLGHYIDPTSAGYGNRTKAAELAGFKGTRASQAVEGHRTISLARRHPGLANLLIDTGCTLGRALERVSACMDAKVHRVFLTKDGQVVHVEAGDNHPVQLQAAKLVIDLHGGLGVTHQEPPANAAVENSSQITLPDDLTAEQQELQRKAKTMDPRSRMLTREVIAAQEDVIRAKVKLAEMEAAAASQETENRAEEDEHLS